MRSAATFLEWRRRNETTIPRKLYKCSAATFFKFLEQKGLVDESNTKLVRDLIKCERPDLYELTTTRLLQPVKVDPVADFLEKTAPKQLHEMCTAGMCPCKRSQRLLKKEPVSKKTEPQLRKRKFSETDFCEPQPSTSCSTENPLCSRPTHSCAIKLKIRVEYVDHQEVLRDSVNSTKQQEIERQFDMFQQASTIIKSRDLGTVVCEIKFSDLTSLDAFWRDYTNGILQEALQAVFITEALTESVGDEPLRVIISVKEEEYRRGRLLLLENITG